jgi:uncharacterized protein YoxC
MADGSITIETLLSTDKFDRQIVGLEKKMQKEEEKKITIETQLSSQEQDLERARAEVDKLADAYQRVAELQKQVDKGVATPQQFMELTSLKSEFGSIGQIGSAFDKALNSQEKLTAQVEKTRTKYNDINNKVNEIKQKIEGIKLQKHQADIEGISKSFKNVGSSIQDSIKRVGRLALAIFGIRTALSYLRSASSELASYDEQYATNLEYIRFVLTQAIAPVLQAIVNLAMQLLSYINAIAQAWFGINLFQNGSVENFQKMKKQATGVGKAVKEIKKELLGFDEINRLTDNDTGTSAGAGGVGSVLPSMDLSQIQGKQPEWLEWIIKNKDLILSILAGIVTALELIKLGIGGIQALGIGIAVAGIVYAIQALLEYLKDPTFENFGKVIMGIGIAVIGVGVAITSLPVVLAGVGILIFGIVTKYWNQIKDFLQKGLDWLNNKSDWVHKTFGDTIGAMYDSFVEILQHTFDWLDVLFTNAKDIFDNIIQFVTSVFKGDWSTAWESLINIVTDWFEIMVGRLILPLQLLIDWFNVFADGIAQTFRWVVETVTGWFMDLANMLPQKIGDVIRSALNVILNFVEQMINKPINALNGLLSVVGSVPRCKHKLFTHSSITTISQRFYFKCTTEKEH